MRAMAALRTALSVVKASARVLPKSQNTSEAVAAMAQRMWQPAVAARCTPVRSAVPL